MVLLGVRFVRRSIRYLRIFARRNRASHERSHRKTIEARERARQEVDKEIAKIWMRRAKMRDLPVAEMVEGDQIPIRESVYDLLPPVLEKSQLSPKQLGDLTEFIRENFIPKKTGSTGGH